MFRALVPHTVTVLTTDRCTAECRHCAMNSSPSRTNQLTFEQISHTLGQLFENYRIFVVVYAGGEPTLLGEDLLKSLAFCRSHGVKTRIVTNGYWATSLEAALDKCRELRAAGLDEINLSMDDYHEPYVSLEKVKIAYRAALQVDFRAVVIANACGPQSVLSPEVLEAEFGMGGGEMQRRFDVDGRGTEYRKEVDGRIILMSNGVVQRLGRGAEFVSGDECLANENLDRHIAEIGGCPHAVRSVALSAGNHLVSCCGFELHGNPILDFGDPSKESVKSLLDRADDDLIVNMISMVGPPRLKDMLIEIAPDEVSFPKRHYQSYCEVCQDLVGIEKNRVALYKYQGMFVEPILRVREHEATRPKESRGKHFNLRLEVRSTNNAPRVVETEPQA